MEHFTSNRTSQTRTWSQGCMEDHNRNIQKSQSPAVPPKVPVRELVQEKTKEVNQERAQMKIKPQL